MTTDVRAQQIAILGGGNLGIALARGWARAGRFLPGQITVTRRQVTRLAPLAAEGFGVASGSADAVAASDLVVLAVQPKQLDALLAEIAPHIDPARHRVISVVSGASIADIRRVLGETRGRGARHAQHGGGDRRVDDLPGG